MLRRAVRIPSISRSALLLTSAPPLWRKTVAQASKRDFHLSLRLLDDSNLFTTESDAKHRSGQQSQGLAEQPPHVGDNIAQQSLSLSHGHLRCFDDPGLLSLEVNKHNSTVIEEIIEANPVQFRKCIIKCLSLQEEEVRVGVSDLLSKLEFKFALATLYKPSVATDSYTIAKIAAEMHRLNLNAASDLLNLAHSCLFKQSARCVVFGGEFGLTGSNRLLNYFRMKPPESDPGNLSGLIEGQGNSWPLVILDAESGNGKTTACVWLATEVNTVTNATSKLVCVLLIVLDKDVMAQPGDSHETRRQHLEKELCALLKAERQRLITDKEREGFQKATWYIALDEVSRIPNLLRTLCVHRMTIAGYLEKELALAPGSVRILAAGTGSAGTVAPGSFPENYKVVTLRGQPKVPPRKDCTEDEFREYININHLHQFSKPATREMWNVMMHIPYIEQAVGNPRFAECLMERCFHVTEKLVDVHPAMITRAMVDTVVGLSSIRFKELNGCSGLTRDNMMQVLAETIKFAIVPAHATEVPSKLAKYGMGRDVAEAKPIKAFKKETEILVAGPPIKLWRFDKDGQQYCEEHVLAVPKDRNRFHVSERQWSLIALGYGRGEPRPHWEDSEQAAALFVRLNMIGLQGETVWQALLTLCGYSNDEDPFDGHCNLWPCKNQVKSKAMNRLLSYSRLVCWTETTKLEKSLFVPNKTVSRKRKRKLKRAGGQVDLLLKQREIAFEARRKEVIPRLQAVLRANLGAVIVNAPQASFADVIFLSRELVILVQSKFYRDATVTEGDVDAVVKEIGKLGITKQDRWFGTFLEDIYSGIHLPLPLVVGGVMTTKQHVDLANKVTNKGKPFVHSPVIQWTVRDGFVDKSKVRFRFPEPGKGEKLPEAIVVHTAADVAGETELEAGVREHFLGPHKGTTSPGVSVARPVNRTEQTVGTGKPNEAVGEASQTKPCSKRKPKRSQKREGGSGSK
jgi:hypothetical protein